MPKDHRDESRVPLGPDDEEVLRREAELDSGAVKAISHEEFLARAGYVARDAPDVSDPPDAP